MRTYRGLRSKTDGSINVRVTTSPGANMDVMIYDLPIEGSQKIRNHSPTGFEWGYCGSGPAQLALAIVLDATDSIYVAKRCYQHFKRQFVVGWSDQWEITSDAILRWITANAILTIPEEDEGGVNAHTSEGVADSAVIVDGPLGTAEDDTVELSSDWFGKEGDLS